MRELFIKCHKYFICLAYNVLTDLQMLALLKIIYILTSPLNMHLLGTEQRVRDYIPEHMELLHGCVTACVCVCVCACVCSD